MTPADLLKSLRSLIGYHHSCGIDHYRRSSALETGLTRLEAATAGPAGDAAEAAPGRARVVPVVGRRASAAAGDGGAASTIAALTGEIANCTLCPLHANRKISTPGKGGLLPALLIVGDWLVHDRGEASGTVLGGQQELMLERMLEAITMDRSRVYITNVVKCSVDGSVRPEAGHIEACLSYLKQQIALLSPAVICTMGAAPAQALLGSSLPLIRLRGRFHHYTSGSGTTIPLMPTFHPSFLLKNEEMKRPTWEDLQAVEKMVKRGRR